ncbi:MAG: amidase [Bryobacterales bacterium]|nr:amidase [Bryobacterales bacterium]
MELPARLGLTQLAKAFSSGQLSPVEVVRHALRRIARLDPVLNSYLSVTADHALERARQAESEIRAGRHKGPLHGVPYAAKDLLDTKGIRTTVGSRILSDNVPAADAAVVESLSAAGAILLGKTGMHEWAYGITNNNPHFGPVRNPWNTECIPGGSSGGSAAALAAGLCSFSLGSDTGGSIRIPAALCGIAGLKPTFGRVSRRGAFPLGHTLDTLGPFGLTVQDTALAYQAIAGRDGADPTTVDKPVELPRFDAEPSLKGVVIGVPRASYYECLDPAVDSAVQSALSVLTGIGAQLREVAVPDIDLANSLHRLILLAEGTSVHHRRLEEHREQFGDDVRALLDQGRLVLASDYLNAQRQRKRFCREFARTLQTVDALVAPAVPIPTARIGELEVEVNGRLENVRLATTRNIRALNLTGLPVLSVPCGFHSDGLPIGIQIVGKAFDERRVLEIGHAYETATEWHLRIPPIARSPVPSDTAPGAP